MSKENTLNNQAFLTKTKIRGGTLDWKTFIVGMAKALAWPLAIILIVLFLKDNLQQLISRMRKIKHGKTEASFDEDLTNTNTEANAAGLDPNSVSVDEKLFQLANTNPRIAIIAAWERLEHALISLKADHIRNDPKYKNMEPITLAALLFKSDHISWDLFLLISKLQDLKNKAVDFENTVEEITEHSAFEYLKINSWIIEKLKALKKEGVALSPPNKEAKAAAQK